MWAKRAHSRDIRDSGDMKSETVVGSIYWAPNGSSSHSVSLGIILNL